MKLRIDIVTPGGIHLEGFPFETTEDQTLSIENGYFSYFIGEKYNNVNLDTGDKITIEVLP